MWAAALYVIFKITTIEWERERERERDRERKGLTRKEAQCYLYIDVIVEFDGAIRIIDSIYLQSFKLAQRKRMSLLDDENSSTMWPFIDCMPLFFCVATQPFVKECKLMFKFSHAHSLLILPPLSLLTLSPLSNCCFLVVIVFFEGHEKSIKIKFIC